MESWAPAVQAYKTDIEAGCSRFDAIAARYIQEMRAAVDDALHGREENPYLTQGFARLADKRFKRIETARRHLQERAQEIPANYHSSVVAGALREVHDHPQENVLPIIDGWVEAARTGRGSGPSR